MDAVEEVLARLRGHAVHFVRHPGNNGDRLIELGTRQVFARQQIGIAGARDRPAAVVVSGGGAITPLHGGEALLIDICGRYADTPLVVLPSTFDLKRPLDLLAALGARKAPATLIARDTASFEQLAASGIAGAAEIKVDHDMALALQGSAFLERLRGLAPRDHLLIVERTDIEAFTGRRDRLGFLEREQPAIIRRMFPTPLRKGVREAMAFGRRAAFRTGIGRAALSPFALEARAAVTAELPPARDWPVIAADIGQSSLCSFGTFCRLVAQAGAVVSNRLHTAILARLLERPAFLYAGPSRRMRAVYEYSLAPMDGVTLMD